ncbi:class I tRNA ligase family protein [Streptomyces sp. NBC_00090]
MASIRRVCCSRYPCIASRSPASFVSSPSDTSRSAFCIPDPRPSSRTSVHAFTRAYSRTPVPSPGGRLSGPSHTSRSPPARRVSASGPARSPPRGDPPCRRSGRPAAPIAPQGYDFVLSHTQAHVPVDVYRWYFLRAIAFGQDGSFSWEDFTARYASELANDYGNLASHVAAMVGKYFGGALPASAADGDAEKAIQDGLAKAVATADAKIGEELDFQGGILAIFDFVKQVNGYITEQEPWKVAKDESPEGQARLATILYTAAESLRAVAVLLNSIMPETSQALWESLAAQPVQDAATWGQLPAGATVTKGAVLFPRLEEPKKD